MVMVVLAVMGGGGGTLARNARVFLLRVSGRVFRVVVRPIRTVIVLIVSSQTCLFHTQNYILKFKFLYNYL